MAEENVFAGDQPAGNPEVKPQENATAENLLEMITDADGVPKYKTPEDALFALKHSQDHISRIEAENQQLRSDAELGDRMDKLFTKLEAEPKQVDTTPSVGITAEDVKGMTMAALQEYETANKVKSNLDIVNAGMKEKFGEDSKLKVAQKAAELGVDVPFLQGMAERSPEGFLKLFPTEAASGTPNVDTGAVNTDNGTDRVPGKITVDSKIMYGASSAEITDVWNQVKSSVANQNG